MGLLTVCAQHYEGLFWLAFFYVLLNLMPQTYRWFNENAYRAQKGESTALRYAPGQYVFALIFGASLYYSGSILPCGRFYYDAYEGFTGNSILRMSYQYLYLYLGFLAHFTSYFDRAFGALLAYCPWLERNLVKLERNLYA